MTIHDLSTAPINEAIAYIVGLLLPLYKEACILGEDCLLGSINHNSGKVTSAELDEHFQAVRSLLDSYACTKRIKILNNLKEHIQRKEGFSIILKKGNTTKEECLDLLLGIAKKIKQSSNDIQKEFVKGCFDGRSSWDNTAHYLAVDVDRDYPRQDLIISIIENVGINLNVNRRDINHPKNDQLSTSNVEIRKSSSPSSGKSVGLFNASSISFHQFP